VSHTGSGLPLQDTQTNLRVTETDEELTTRIKRNNDDDINLLKRRGGVFMAQLPKAYENF